MRKEFLHFSPPSITDIEINEVIDTLKGIWLSTGPKTKKFEEAFRAHVHSEDVFAVNSCTAALHLALKILGVGPGDEVITTPLTFCATANVVEHLGGTVVLADINADTLLIDPKEIEKKITKKTKVIIPVHYAGNACDMDAINALGKKHNIHILEDAAHSFPTKYNGKMIGDTKNLCAFSFYATKNITTSEGGMLTGPEELISQARVMGLHGMSKDAWKRFDKGGSWKYDVEVPGYKYNMTDLQSALGLAQLSRLSELMATRKTIYDIYQKNFEGNKFFDLTRILDNCESPYHLYVIKVNPEALKISRDQFIEELKTRNIGTSVHYIPVHMHSYYYKKYGWKASDFPVASNIGERIISIPLNNCMTAQDAQDVVEAIQDICAKNEK
jgi:dTDP-4-amino-4,6-dideoxygalactose transaminase